ncbi:MAG: hypothetical protein HYV62_06605 [Candidatus Rokubacteria bacterium]|nr:hypothetical protein [Candidatus Rokubacteria bacterium]
MAPAPGTRWLIVVRQDQRPLFRLLDRHFAEDSRVEVILDRREREGRQSAVAVEAERRRADRREFLSARERDVWHTFGYRLVVQAEPAG